MCSIALQKYYFVHLKLIQTTLGQIFLTSRKAFRGLGGPTRRTVGLATPNGLLAPDAFLVGCLALSKYLAARRNLATTLIPMRMTKGQRITIRNRPLSPQVKVHTGQRKPVLIGRPYSSVSSVSPLPIFLVRSLLLRGNSRFSSVLRTFLSFSSDRSGYCAAVKPFSVTR